MELFLIVSLVFIVFACAGYWRYRIARHRLAMCMKNNAVDDYNTMSITISTTMTDVQIIKILREKQIIDISPWFFHAIDKIRNLKSETN